MTRRLSFAVLSLVVALALFSFWLQPTTSPQKVVAQVPTPDYNATVSSYLKYDQGERSAMMLNALINQVDPQGTPVPVRKVDFVDASGDFLDLGTWGNIDGVGATTKVMPVLPLQTAFNGTSWDRWRNNIEATLLASAARTATATSDDQVNYNHRGLILIVDVTARAASTTITPTVQIKDPIGSDYITIWTASAAIDSSDTTVAYLFYPGVTASAPATFTEEVDLALPRTWRIGITHSDGNSVTYSVAGSLVL